MNAVILLLSNIVSCITIALCFILKVPQIIRLFKAGSSVGLSLSALMLELSSYTTTMMYNYTNGHAYLTYLEYPILLFQEYIIIGLVLYYSNRGVLALLKIILIYGVISMAFAYGILSKVILQLLLPCTVPVGALSKGMQFWEIVKTGNSESVSTLTWFLSVFTNVTRIFTVYVDSADTVLLCNFSISSFFSLSVLLAAMYYKKKPKVNTDSKSD